MSARVVVRRPAAFDSRLEAAFASGLRFQEGGAAVAGWVHSAEHESVSSKAAGRRRMPPKQPRATEAGIAYTYTVLFPGKDAWQAAATRDAAVAAVNRGGVCSLQVEGGVTGLCEYAADLAELDPFDPKSSLLIESSKATKTAVPPGAAPAAPVCGLEGQDCDGVTLDCCSWAFQECDLRPDAPTRGTCRSLTGRQGPTCKKQGEGCSHGWQCCPFLKCAGGGPAGRRCTWTPDQASLSVNVSMTSPGGYDAAVQEGLLSAVQRWLLLEGTGAASTRVVGYEPLRAPTAAEWERRGRTYHFEVVLGAPTAAALDGAVKAALRALGGGTESGALSRSAGGPAKSGGGGFCSVAVSSLGEGATLCSLAKARCDELRKQGDGPPCSVITASSSATAISPAPPRYKELACRREGEPCEGPFNVAGTCCAGHSCALRLPGADPRVPTGVCKPNCTQQWDPCKSDSECCGYWGPLKCNPTMGACLPPSFNWTWPSIDKLA